MTTEISVLDIPDHCVAYSKVRTRKPYATGCGKNIPTPYKVLLLTSKGFKWFRVYARSLGNTATFYVLISGKRQAVVFDHPRNAD